VLYLVCDPERKVPFWVRLHDVRQLRSGGRQPAQAQAPASASATHRPGLSVLGYVSLVNGDRSELSQYQAAIEAACERRGWTLQKLVHDMEPEHGRSGADQRGLAWALEQLAAGEASGLVVAKLDHLSRSVSELGRVVPWFLQAQIPLVAVDVMMDTTTPAGRLTAKALATVGGGEMERIGARTRRGLEAARTERGSASRPAVRDDPELAGRIASMRSEGLSLQAIADRLNAEGVPTLRGGAKWRPSSVQAAVGYKRPSSSQHNGVPLPAIPTNGHRAANGADVSAGRG
jgi:DNA invertase Pin-like site-specific DNA recombinase